MKVFVAFAALLQLAACSSHVSVRLPFLNPAGVTYVNGYQGAGGYAYGTTDSGAYSQPQPLQYQAGLQYQSAGLQYQSAGLQYQSPLQHQAALRYAAPAPAAVYPAKVEAHHVGYAAAQVPAVAAVPFVKHVPTVSNIPVTRYEAHHGVIEKQVDVAKPAVSTRKFEVRRPAIQKQFYDIEERVIIRPAGSALVELDEPSSKLQRGPAVLSEAAPVAVTPSPFAHHLVAHTSAFANAPSAPTSIPLVAHAPVHVTVAPVISHAPVSHIHNPSQAASASTFGDFNRPDEESVVVENADFRNAQFRNGQLESAQLRQNLFRSSQQLNENQAASRSQERQYQEYLRNQQSDIQYQQQEQQQQQQELQQQQQFQQRQLQQQHQQQQQAQQQQQQQEQQNLRFRSGLNVITRSNGAPLETIARFASQNSGPSVIPSTRTSPEEGRSNQQRLIELLTARGGVAEVGFGRDGSSLALGDAGNVRARVLSATPAPEYAEAAGERVSTRRVVVSKPVETLQEIDVLEPATKFERISVHQPTLIKTAHLDNVQVHGSVPVIGKALTPTIAHAAVPVYQKTITPAAYQHQYY